MIFDTNILIYADRGVASAKELIMSTQHRSISAVTYMEYVPFCRNKKELATFEKMLQALQFTIREIDHGISYHARQLVRQFALSHSMEMGDALIAATAMAHNELLCTGNIKHFSQITGLLLDHFQPNEP
ncbi:type II toxin-antitoxin system VapC family toxin [Methylomonas sp. LW13]|uniref:type II toxin-antitoxin system VapC family toxin n=1 Tax=unclassified Methylomonas TaxID=2608980 RepID=UPI00051B66C7|nr:type II toxin-antitoxin system VapC family toxin [Methylomonas sp. LW13]QBC28792.1 type II toxin-antitoxin system VapC family toxin [Methylomonas sp. LW13]